MVLLWAKNRSELEQNAAKTCSNTQPIPASSLEDMTVYNLIWNLIYVLLTILPGVLCRNFCLLWTLFIIPPLLLSSCPLCSQLSPVLLFEDYRKSNRFTLMLLRPQRHYSQPLWFINKPVHKTYAVHHKRRWSSNLCGVRTKHCAKWSKPGGTDQCCMTACMYLGQRPPRAGDENTLTETEWQFTVMKKPWKETEVLTRNYGHA